MRHRSYSPAWTEGSSRDPGIALLELLAFLGEALSWYQDQIANEARPGTRRRYAVVLATCAALACWQKYRARRS